MYTSSDSSCCTEIKLKSCISLLLLVLAASTRAQPNEAVANVEKENDDKLFPVQRSVCYEDLGCFLLDGDFKNFIRRPISKAPQSPDEIKAQFQFFSRKNPKTYVDMKYNNLTILRSSAFDGKKVTIIICHGFTDSTVKSPWLYMARDALLAQGDYNVFIIDWGVGAATSYPQAASNTRVVGALMARMVRWLEGNAGADRKRVHLIGHSLGAHTVGYAGETLAKDGKPVGRITGLDPAEPYFEGMPPSVRLDHTDGAFVDVIHTDSDFVLTSYPRFQGGMGSMQLSGHVDFFPNGGKSQKDCHNEGIISRFFRAGIKGLMRKNSCDHQRVTFLLLATIKHPRKDFLAYECDSYDNFLKGNCLSCKNNKCAEMGMRAIEWKPQGRHNVKMYLQTSGADPFSVHHYAVTVKFSKNGSSTRYGDLKVRLYDESGEATDVATAVKSAYFKGGRSVKGLVWSPKKVLKIHRIQVEWIDKSWTKWFITHIVHVDHVSVFVGYTQKSYKFNAWNFALHPKKALSLFV